VPLSALTAWQALFSYGELLAGQRVLIHGGAGGVGTFAVQLARWRAAHVIATASGQNAEFLRELGANVVIDYTTTRFEEKLRDIDLVVDTIGGDTLERSWGILRRGGLLVSLPAPIATDKPEKYGVRGVFFIVESNRNELMEIARLIDAGMLRPVIAEVLPLARAREVFEHGIAGHKRGKIVLQVK
jgi:NADPH:quinone reductase-like Zn-dependent oxidoreductase